MGGMAVTAFQNGEEGETLFAHPAPKIVAKKSPLNVSSHTVQ